MDGHSELRRKSTSDSTQNGLGEGGSRKERAAPAAQACETCRSRKSRCDEGRPLCGTCKKLGLDCKYREPQLTKKDKSIEVLTNKVKQLRDTQVHVSADIKDVKEKLDVLTNALLHGQTVYGVSTIASAQSAMAMTAPYNQQPGIPYETVTSVDPESPQVLDRVAAFRQVLAWPRISDVIMNFASTSVESQNAALRFQKTPWSWVQQLEMLKHPHPLPSDGHHGPTMAFGFVEPANAVSSLTTAAMRTYTDVYFATIGQVWPHIISSGEFETSIMPMVVTTGFDRTTDQIVAVTALLVFALGKGAMNATFGDATRPGSGIRGGTVESPPGLDLFNEARKRIGYTATESSVENARIHLLAGLFYEINSRHMDFWRCVMNASVCVQALDRCSEDSGPYVETQLLLKRLRYLCYILEQSISFAVGLPRSIIVSNFDNLQSSRLNETMLEPGDAPQIANIQALGNLFNISDQAWTQTNAWAIERSSTIVSFELPPGSCALVNISQQLDRWREVLPVDLQWADTDRFSSSNPTRVSTFATQLGADYANLDEIAEVLFAATIRSGYYYTRYLAYRPAVFKALHNPEDVNEQDCNDAVKCLEAALLWPVSAYPCALWKRIIPSTYIWTQAFVEILLIFYVAQDNQVLQPAVRENLNTADVDRTIALLMDWVRDMSQVDGLAGWVYDMLTAMYGV